MSLEIIILAAGQGTRMRSGLPKVLHKIGGQPMLSMVVETAVSLQPAAIHIVVGHGREQIIAYFEQNDSYTGCNLNWIQQDRQLGTGHAVMQAMPHVSDDAQVLVLYGDVPLITAQTLLPLVTAVEQSETLKILTMELSNPHGLGRIVRDDDGNIERIVEQKDATAHQRAITEINTGMMATTARSFNAWLGSLGNQNAQGEYYLTDCVAMAVADGTTVIGERAPNEEEILGVNSKVELARVERLFQQRQASVLMQAGVTLRDPGRFDLRGSCQTGQDCEIDIDVVLEGEVVLGEGVKIGPHCLVKNSVLGDGVIVHAHTTIEGARISNGCSLGPYARIRPDTELAPDVRIGNFVEVKKSNFGEGSKANHLAYIGDSDVGRDVNIGAGTITCNYDGANKRKTTIGDGAFVGSNSVLVAPVKVGAGAFVGAGSTVSRTAPDDKLTIARARQKVIEGWQRPVKKSK